MQIFASKATTGMNYSARVEINPSEVATVHYVETYTSNEARVADRTTRVVGEGYYQRQARDSDREPWSMLIMGQYVPVLKREVPAEVRMSWVYAYVPIRAGEKLKKEKEYVDVDTVADFLKRAGKRNFN